MGVNLMATIWGIEIFGPLIEQHGEGGHIVSTASIAGLMLTTEAMIADVQDEKGDGGMGGMGGGGMGGMGMGM